MPNPPGIWYNVREGKSEHESKTDAHACMRRPGAIHENAPASPGKRSFSGLLPDLRLLLSFFGFIKQLLAIYYFPVCYSPYTFMFFPNHCYFFLPQGRRIKNYFPVKVVTNIFHPIPLLVFSDSCFLLLFSHSLVW